MLFRAQPSILRDYRRTLIFLIFPAVILTACALRFSPLPVADGPSSAADIKKQDHRPVFRFFDDDFVSGGYSYIYPEKSRIYIPEESGHESEVSLQLDLVADEYSGGSVCLYNLLYDMRPYLSQGALQFWVKGNKGGEIAWIALVDDENRDGIKTVVRLPLSDYGVITDQWSLMRIPLADFGTRGVFWDPKKKVEVPYKFDWDAVCEFRMEIKKGDNPAFRVWVDDIFVLSDVFEKKALPAGEYWDAIEETVPSPPKQLRPDVDIHSSIFEDGFGGGFAYVYGGKTAHKIQPGSDTANTGILAMYMDGSDYSGVSIAMGAGRNMDLAALRKTNAGVAFWGKGGPGVSRVYLGLLDDESDGAKVQTKLGLGDFGKIDTNWKYYMVPLKKFQAGGLFWDADKKAERSADIQWDKINEVRISVNRFENKVPENEPVKFFLDDISIIKNIPDYVDPDEFWAAFKSDAHDLPLHDFESAEDRKWEMGLGPKSKLSFTFPSAAETGYGKKSLEIDYHLGDWCDVYYDYRAKNSPSKLRNWTKHWGLRFSFYTDKGYQAVTVQVQDAGNEVWVSNAGGGRGWNEILVPFSSFSKFPYYQPPDAEENGTFDLKGVTRLDFKPVGEGSKGTFKVDNVKLTNTRELQRAKVKESVQVVLTGDLKKTVTEKINDGIFGINAALWDGDLEKPETAEYVKQVNHAVLRYPGGLRADEDHWKDVLEKKDWLVDTDEFMAFCRKTGNGAMYTVNFGRGTPEEAAAWVKHTNKDRKDNIRYWEVGNELYGDWHANHCTAEEYGKRAAEFIRAMKAVDPAILVAVVWVLEGEWNRIVFEHTKDLADAVIIHHYPQHGGEENDLAILTAPATLDDIIPAVKEQISKWGASGKHYEIWLTEWNSVDFNPGPQTLGIVNALFVADYLGTLARHNIEQASYWDIHNSITPQGGDYGYLSRTGAPDGDNVPRPSYWAFKLASEGLRGRLADCRTDDENVSCYLAEKEGTAALLIINKYPDTKADIQLPASAITGQAVTKQLTVMKRSADGPVENTIHLDGKITVPPHSVTLIKQR